MFFVLSKTRFPDFVCPLGVFVRWAAFFAAFLEAPQRAEKLVLILGDPAKHCYVYCLFAYSKIFNFCIVKRFSLVA
jgi:hypothetical protein